MNIQKDNIELMTIVLNFISSIIAILHGLYKNYNIIFYVSVFCICVTGCFLCFYWIKRVPVQRRYKFIRYLFFEISENKFNIAPKILLFLDLKKKKNNFRVESLSATYTIMKNNDGIDSSIMWSLEEISNVVSNNFYLYTGIDLGEIQNQKLSIINNNNEETIDLLSDNKVDSGNDINLCHWDIPRRTIRDGKKIDNIILTMEQKNSFDFKNKEVIYFFPWNFANKINKVKFKIIYPSTLGKISMQLFEVGKVKGKKFPHHHSLETTVNENFNKENNAYIYEFCIEKENLNIDNLYYILLHKI